MALAFSRVERTIQVPHIKRRTELQSLVRLFVTGLELEISWAVFSVDLAQAR